MGAVSGIWLICLIMTMEILCSLAEDDVASGERYIAKDTPAKDDWLLKSSNTEKKSSQESKEIFPSENQMYLLNDDILIDYPSDVLSKGKRMVGTFFNSRERPSIAASVRNGPGNPSEEDASSMEMKRNVASRARLGRLNAIRYGRFQSRLVGSKRLNSEERTPKEDISQEDNGVDILGEIKCYGDDDNDDAIAEVNPNLVKKRYVAALARSGRLPVWHPQRMWGAGKRDDSLPYWDSSKYVNDNNFMTNSLKDSTHERQKIKRCKKLFDYKMEKRNVAVLAKNGKLPYSVGRRNEFRFTRTGDLLSDNHPTGKQNVAALAKNEKLPFNEYEHEKRNIQAMARNGKLLFNRDQEDKRNLAALARSGKLPFNYNVDDKRNIQAIARNGNLLFNSNQNGKKNVQSMARNGKLPTFIISEEDKRNVAALARNGKLLSSFPGNKRNIQAMARNGNLPFNSYQNEKRNAAVMFRSGKLLLNSSPNDTSREENLKSNENTLAYNFEKEKRNLAALARNQKLPFRYFDEKKNVASLARNRKLRVNGFQSNKRDGENKSFVEKNEDLDDNEEVKRNIAALVRNGNFPHHSYNKNKRYIAALARSGKLPSYNGNGKRNIAALARTGKLPGSI